MLQWKFDFPWICYVFLWNKENILNLVFTILQYWTPGKVAFELSEQNIETEAMCFCKIYIFELYNTYWNILQHLMYVYIFIWMRKNNKPFRSEYLNSGQRKKYIDQEPPYLMRQICVLQWEEIKTKNSRPCIIFEGKDPRVMNKNI